MANPGALFWIIQLVTLEKAQKRFTVLDKSLSQASNFHDITLATREFAEHNSIKTKDVSIY